MVRFRLLSLWKATWFISTEEWFKRLFKSKWFHWTLQAVAIGLCLWWWSHVPAPGKAVLALTIVAVVMTIEGLTGWQRALWLIIVFSLAFLENRAIDKDRRDFAETEARRRQEENEKFAEIGTNITTNVQKLLDNSNTQFDKTTARQASEFTTTMKEFTEVNEKQLVLAQSQKEMIESENGHLLPGDEPMPPMDSLGCHGELAKLANDVYIIAVGRYVTQVTRFPFSPMSFDEEVNPPVSGLSGLHFVQSHNVVRVDKSLDGLLVVSLDFRGADGSIIVKIDQDGFVINPTYIKRHPDKSTLVVWDSFGKEVLKVRYVNKRLLRIEPHIIADTEFLFDTSKPLMCMPQMNGKFLIMPALQP